MPKEKLIEQKLAAILQEEARKHETHVGFAILTIYKDGRSVAKTAARPGFEGVLIDRVHDFWVELSLPHTTVFSA